MMEQMIELFQYGFMYRAIFAGSLIALSCSLLGVFLVLRRFSLIGDGLAHVSFATIAVGLLVQVSPLVISLPLVAAASLLILKLNEKAVLYGDAAIGLVSSFGIAAGVMLASLAGGFNIDLLSYLFGNILVVTAWEVKLAGIVTLIIVTFIICFYHDLFSITFDEEFAHVSGIKIRSINQCFILLTAMMIVLGIKVVGTLLVSSLIILPAVTALQIARCFKTALVCAVCCSVSSVVIGIILSCLMNTPSGATIVLLNFLFFIVSFLCRWMAGVRS